MKDLKLQDQKIQEKYNLNGYIPSPEDERDFTVMTALDHLESLPEEYNNPFKAKVLNQGSVGSCVAHAIATTMAYVENKLNSKSPHDYSRGFIYGNRRPLDYSGEGMITRQALKNVNHEGDCLYPTFPWNEKYEKVAAKIKNNPDKYKAEAAKYKIKNYFRCYDEQDIKQAIYNNGAVVMCIELYEGFGRDVQIPKPEDKKRGGHAMCCVGWDKTGWIVQNSWSALWGYKGYCHIPYEYKLKECWGITLELNSKPSPKVSIFTKIFNWLKTWFKRLFLKK